MTILKTLKHKYCLTLVICHKYVVQFTDPTSTIFWYAKRVQLNFLKYTYIPIESNKNNARVSGLVSNAIYNL